MITTIVCDIDGTLTDGRIIFDSTGTESKNFSVKDGFIIKAMPKLGIAVIFLTARDSIIVEKRGRELDVSDILQGIHNKKDTLMSYMAAHDLSPENVAYIGDDLNDYEAMSLCGFKACPEDAVYEIRELCDYVSSCRGGHGAARDVCEHILKRNGQYEKFLDLFRGS